MYVSSVIQNNDRCTSRGSNGLNDVTPVTQSMIRQRRIYRDGKDVEVADFGGDFISNDRGEESPYS